MCGISGILAFNDVGIKKLDKINQATHLLHHRGPDSQGILIHEKVALGHARLSIIDVSAASNQPFTSNTGSYSIVFNGEIFNFAELRESLIEKGYTFSTNGDVEVLLNLYIEEKEHCLNKLKGFFAFSVYDREKGDIFIARDRFGVKPLYYFINEDFLCWSSELRSVQYINEGRELNLSALNTYLQLNYLPGARSILSGIKRLEPGTFLYCTKQGHTSTSQYYRLKLTSGNINNARPEKKLRHLLTESVKLRLIADVPVGSFLSGGIDSTVITGIAAGLSPHINTFSLGFKDNHFFDETRYAELAAKKFSTNHHTFRLSNDDLLEKLFDFLNAIDEPFADSSALNVYILSQHTKKHVKVALSGDGADELFAGYNKHRAEWMMRHKHGLNSLVNFIAPPLRYLPQSRNSFFGNKARQLQRYYSGLQLSKAERYWQWASICSEKEVQQLLNASSENIRNCNALKQHLLSEITEDFNSILLTDMKLILPYDMLTKVDMMSMANGLEVRNPFLDHDLVDYVFSLPCSLKINREGQKLLLKKAFADLLPAEILNRPKHGFEIPLQQWFKNELRNEIERNWLSDEFINFQNIFNLPTVQKLRQQLFSSSPGDSAAKVWALIIFNNWWKKHIFNASAYA